MTTAHTCVELLRALHATCDGVTEFRTFRPGDSGPPSGRAFLRSDDANSLSLFIGSHLDEHNYFGVATRKDGSSGTLENCIALPALFCDIDFKQTPEAETRRRITECPFAPSAVVRSGGGLHVYWLLQEPLNLQEPTECAMARALLRRLARFLAADLVAAEPARVLRLPGSSNFKYTPPRQVVVELLEPERRYHASEFDELLPAEPVETGPAGPFVSPERICDGERNDRLYRLGRSLKAKGLSHSAIRAALHAENLAKCEPPCEDAGLERVFTSVFGQADRPEFAPRAFVAEHGGAEQAAHEDPGAPPLLGLGLGEFLALDFPPLRSLVEGLLSDDGGGWISGEEKLGKSYYALEEALCLALGHPVCGRFAVPARVRVLFVEEEDSPRRAHRRVKQLLRGHGLNPDDSAVRAELDQWFLISVWTGFTLDEPAKVAQLRQTLNAFRPVVVYLDVLRKLTTKNLNKGDEAGAFLQVLDDQRREFDVLFRIIAHNRKIQGSFRAGRGSQEIAGSHALGAWAENSLFFEPIGKKQGAVKIEVQRKDGALVPAFGLRFEVEGPEDDPTLVRLHAEELSTTSAAEALKEKVAEAVANLPPTEPVSGDPGVLKDDICTSVKRSDRPVKTALKSLQDEGQIKKVGKATRGRDLYAVVPQEN